ALTSIIERVFKMTEAESVSITPRASSPKTRKENQFASLAEAEAFLQSDGFHLVPDSCNWTNVEGDDAGVGVASGENHQKEDQLDRDEGRDDEEDCEQMLIDELHVRQVVAR